MTVKVKICGVTRVADALAAAEAGADAIGLNFWRPGRRFVPPARAAEIVAALAELHAPVLPVAVFVDAPLAEMEAILAATGCRAAQLHGDEPPALAAALGGRCWRALRAGAGSPGEREPGVSAVLAEAERWPAAVLLVDTPHAALPGGSGLAHAASRAAVRALRAAGRDAWLAGGLTPENVAAAIADCSPSGVDVAGGVEAAPGLKDHARLRAFVAAARGSP